MLETDCIIPHHVPIPHREFFALHGTALSVKTLMDDGLSEFAIRRKLHIGEEAYRDAVYEINKQNAVTEWNQYFKKENETMPRGEKLNAETVERIRELKADGKTVKEIMEEVGCGRATVGRVCKAGKDKPAEIEQVAEPVVMTEEHTATIPKEIMTAVNERINTLSETLSDNLLSIKKMQQENENLRSELAVLYQWKNDNENEG